MRQNLQNAYELQWHLYNLTNLNSGTYNAINHKILVEFWMSNILDQAYNSKMDAEILAWISLEPCIMRLNVSHQIV